MLTAGECHGARLLPRRLVRPEVDDLGFRGGRVRVGVVTATDVDDFADVVHDGRAVISVAHDPEGNLGPLTRRGRLHQERAVVRAGHEDLPVGRDVHAGIQRQADEVQRRSVVLRDRPPGTFRPDLQKVGDDDLHAGRATGIDEAPGQNQHRAVCQGRRGRVPPPDLFSGRRGHRRGRRPGVSGRVVQAGLAEAVAVGLMPADYQEPPVRKEAVTRAEQVDLRSVGALGLRGADRRTVRRVPHEGRALVDVERVVGTVASAPHEHLAGREDAPVDADVGQREGGSPAAAVAGALDSEGEGVALRDGLVGGRRRGAGLGEDERGVVIRVGDARVVLDVVARLKRVRRQRGGVILFVAQRAEEQERTLVPGGLRRRLEEEQTAVLQLVSGSPAASLELVGGDDAQRRPRDDRADRIAHTRKAAWLRAVRDVPDVSEIRHRCPP